MKQVAISRQTKITISLAIFICTLAVRTSERLDDQDAERRVQQKQVDFNTAAIVVINSKLDRLLEMKTDIEVIRTKVQAMERPVYHTDAGVNSPKKQANEFRLGPLYANPFNRGPYGAR